MAFHGRAHPVEAVAFSSVAGHRVLDVEVLGALPGESGAQLGQVALVGGLPARGAGRLQFAIITAGSIRTVGLSFQPEIGSTKVVIRIIPDANQALFSVSSRTPTILT